MDTTNETSLMKAADPASVFIGSTLDTSTGSVVFSGLEKGAAVVPQEVEGLSPDQETSTPHTLSDSTGLLARYTRLSTPEDAAEAQDAPPVASGPDWFEIAGLALVAEGHISETRYRRALAAVRQGVDRE